MNTAKTFVTLLLFTGIATTFSCHQSGDVVFLGAAHQLAMQNEEYMGPRDQDEIDEYNECCNIFPDAQIPLYRVFHGENYTYFLGIPLDRSPDMLALAFSEMEAKSFELTEEFDNYWLLEKRGSDYCLNIFLFTLHEDEHFLVAFKSESENLCNQTNHREWLTDRIEDI